jgi:putative Holliday junction resolvase
VRLGRRLGLDPGSVRIGIAVTDREGLVASRREPIPAGEDEVWLGALRELADEIEPIEVVVGLPVGMDGRSGAAAERARVFAARVRDHLSIPVRLVDERLSTVQAQRGFHDQGRSVRKSRTMIDSAAAEIVLQHAVDTERATGQPPGEVHL